MLKLKLMIIWAFTCLIIACNSNAPKTANKQTADSDPLPSWNDGPTKQAIIAYVNNVTGTVSKNFVPVAERIATFDNDGTLWSEQPVYFQLFYALDEIKAMSAKHADWKTKQPFKAVLDNNMSELMKQGEKGLLQIVATTHAGMNTEQFDSTVTRWIDTAKHPIKKKLYKELIYQPMLELVTYLQANEFKVFIVSGGGRDFMRAWAENVYSIPKDQIIGSSIKSKFEYNNGKPVIIKLPELEFNDDKEGKPVAIMEYIGRKPIFSAGNSDGDLAMLQWAASNKFKNFELYVHHTDSVREWAYDRKSHIGMLNKGLDEANAKKWAIADMRTDWKIIYPFEKKGEK